MVKSLFGISPQLITELQIVARRVTPVEVKTKTSVVVLLVVKITKRLKISLR